MELINQSMCMAHHKVHAIAMTTFSSRILNWKLIACLMCVVFINNTYAGSKHNQYIQMLPENTVSVSLDKSTSAFYANPTKKYTHGVLGDAIEAEKLIVQVDDHEYQLTLSEDEVFEDIRPRLFDVDQDGKLEFITIRSSQVGGAGIGIYKIIDEQLREFAYVPTIGLANRWLNIVAINDLDNDGTVEIAWIQTPHIGGILQVAHITQGKIQSVTQKRYFSNHAIGERNLCLSVVAEDNNGNKLLYVSTQDRNAIVGLAFENDQLQQRESILQTVDFSKPLYQQYSFNNLVTHENNCIFFQPQ